MRKPESISASLSFTGVSGLANDGTDDTEIAGAWEPRMNRRRPKRARR